MRARDALPALVAVSILANCSPAEGPDVSAETRAPSATTQELPTPSETPTTAETTDAVQAKIVRNVGFIAIDASTPKLDSNELHSLRLPVANEAVRRIEAGSGGLIDLTLKDKGHINVTPTKEQQAILSSESTSANERLAVQEQIITGVVQKQKRDGVDAWVVSFKDTEQSYRDVNGQVHRGAEFVVGGVPVAAELNEPQIEEEPQVMFPEDPNYKPIKELSRKTPDPNVIAHEYLHAETDPAGTTIDNLETRIGHSNISGCDQLIMPKEQLSLPIKLTPKIAQECSSTPYGNMSDVMGNSREANDVNIMNSVDMLRLGLLGKDQVRVLTKSGHYTVSLDSLGKTGEDSIQMIRIPIDPGRTVPVNSSEYIDNVVRAEPDGSWSYVLQYSVKLGPDGKTIPDLDNVKLMVAQFDENGLPAHTSDTYGLPLSHVDIPGKTANYINPDIGLDEKYRGLFFEQTNLKQHISIRQTATTEGGNGSAALDITILRPQ